MRKASVQLRNISVLSSMSVMSWHTCHVSPTHVSCTKTRITHVLCNVYMHGALALHKQYSVKITLTLPWSHLLDR